MRNARVDILLVDDQPANLLALEAVLADLGENLVRARSGEEALRRVLETDYAAVLLDVRLPGLSGLETVRLIRARPRSRATPILFLTGIESPEFPLREAYALGTVDYLLKPLVPEILRAKVALFVDFYRTTRALRDADRRAAAAARRGPPELWQTALASIGDGGIATDADARVAFLNAAAARFTGWPLAAAAGRRWPTCAPSSTRRPGRKSRARCARRSRTGTRSAGRATPS